MKLTNEQLERAAVAAEEWAERTKEKCSFVFVTSLGYG